MAATSDQDHGLRFPGVVELVAGLLGATLLGVFVWLAAKMPASLPSCPSRSIFDLQFAGTPARLTDIYRCLQPDELGTVLRSLQFDSLLVIPLYVALLMRWCRIGMRILRTHASRHTALVGIIATGMAGALDYVENVSLWRAHDSYIDGSVSSGWTAFAFGASVLKWMLLVFAVWNALRAYGRAVGLARLRSPGPTTAHIGLDSMKDHWAFTGRSGLGISFSGGGIRSAIFSMGAYQSLRNAKIGDRFAEAEYVTAVSGGGYFAGSEYLLRSGGVDKPFHPQSDEEDHVRRHSKYLADSFAEWIFLFARALIGIALNIGLLLLIVTALGRLLGWAVRWLERGLQAAGASPELGPLTFGGVRAALTICVVGALGASIMAVLAAPNSDARQHGPGGILWHVASILVGLGLTVVVVMIVAPLLSEAAFNAVIDQGRRARGVIAGTGSFLVALGGWLASRAKVEQLLTRVKASGEADEGLLAKLRRSATKARLRVAARLAPRLTGFVLVLVALVVFADSFQDGRSAGPRGVTRLFWVQTQRQWIAEVISAGILLVLYLFADQTSWSAHPFYKRRLASAFALRRDPRGNVGEFPYRDPTTFGSVSRGPKLILCAAANTSGADLAPPGRKAVSLTLEWDRVGGRRLGYTSRERFEEVLGRNRADATLTAAMAISGAAVASAMGRHSMGTINALLAVMNVRLGVWLPTPAYVNDVEAGTDRRATIRRFTYLFRELFGIHTSDGRFMYMTDGGHWENLGLVELLYRRCNRILCFDASGGPRTLREACELAQEEFGIAIRFNRPLQDVAAGTPAGTDEKLSGRIAKTEILEGDVIYPPIGRSPGFTGKIVYARCVLTPETPEVITAFAKENVKFPNDPTGDQWFDVDQFNHYLWLGRHVGELAATALG